MARSSSEGPRWCAGSSRLIAVAGSIALVALGCSGEANDHAAPVGKPKPDASVDGSAEGGGACTPTTCVALSATCGQAPDGCGGAVSCGNCPSGQFCGGAGPNRCGTEKCTPMSCASLNASCGVVSDGCGEVLSCGNCSPPSTCGGGGLDNQCGCSPSTCQGLGLECGAAADGCGSTLQCGDCAQNEVCASGKCEDDCPVTWKTQAGTFLDDVALTADGKLIIAGENASQGWVASVDSCSGQVGATRTATVAGATSSRLKSVVLSGNDIFVSGQVKAGSDPLDGMVAKLDSSTLSLSWAETLPGTTLSDEAWGLAVANDGSVWVGGTGSIESGLKPWLSRRAPNGGTCSFDFGAGAAYIRAVTSGPEGVYIAGSVDTSGYVLRFDPSSCSTCSCPAAWQTAPINIGAAMTECRALALAGPTMYVGGFFQDQAGSLDYKAFVAQIDSGSGNVMGTWKWNPTAAMDSVQALATDGQRVYVPMVTALDASDISTAKAYVLGLPLAITSSTTPVWSMELPFMGAAMGVAVEAQANGGVYFVGRSVTAGWVVRCTKDGVCPN